MAENFMTIHQYALKHKISTFAVVKLINTKKIKSVKKMIDGEEKELIINDTVVTVMTTPKEEGISAHNTPINYQEEFHKLLAKHLALQAKYDALIEEKALS